MESLDLVWRNDSTGRPNANVANVIGNAVSNWNTENDDGDCERKIMQALKARAVLGSDSFGNGKKNKRYASSPVLKYIRKRCKEKHCVYVAYAPRGTGKTTACHAFLENHLIRGIAFSPPRSISLDYHEQILTLLGMDAENPPKGWLKCLIYCLHQAGPKYEASYLILDEFMSHGMLNPFDVAFLLAVRTLIQQKHVVVIVLTSNESAANYMLELDDLAYIQPMVDPKIRSKIRKHYEKPPIRFNWEKYVSMRWNTEELKASVLSTLEYNDMKEDDKEQLSGTIDDFIDQLGSQRRKCLVPQHIFDHLSTSHTERTPTRETPPSCESCRIM